MQSHGIEAVDCYAVDNALVKPADPLFMGHCYQRKTDCGKHVHSVFWVICDNYCQHCAVMFGHAPPA